MCMRMQKNVSPSFLQMWPCDEPSFNSSSSNDTVISSIKYNMTSGQLQSISSDSGRLQCLTPFSYNEANNAAAGLVLQDCVENKDDRNLHVKQRFHVSKSRVLTGIQTSMCLALKLTAPLNANTMQMWAKSLPIDHEQDAINDINTNDSNEKISQKRAAVFIINADQKQEHSILINNMVLAKIFQTKAIPKGFIKIRDVWKESQPNMDNDETLDENDPNDIISEMFIDQYFSWSVQVPPRDSKFFVLDLNHKR